MANTTIAPKTWELVFDADTDGSFKVVNCNARLLRATSLPTGGGITINSGEHGASEIFTNVSDGVNSLYVYNSSSVPGRIERYV